MEKKSEPVWLDSLREICKDHPQDVETLVGYDFVVRTFAELYERNGQLKPLDIAEVTSRVIDDYKPLIDVATHIFRELRLRYPAISMTYRDRNLGFLYKIEGWNKSSLKAWLTCEKFTEHVWLRKCAGERITAQTLLEIAEPIYNEYIENKSAHPDFPFKSCRRGLNLLRRTVYGSEADADTNPAKEA